MELHLLVSFTFLLSLAYSVDKNNFKTCDQSSFCKRNRGLSPGDSPYYVEPSSLRIEDSGCKMDIMNKKNNVALGVEIYSLVDNTFRLKINEKNPIRKRYEVEGALVKEPELKSCKVQRSSDGVQVIADGTEAVVTFNPFRVDIRINGEIATVLNSRGLLNFEHYREKKVAMPTPTEAPSDDNSEGAEPSDNEEAESQSNKEAEPQGNEDEPGMWEETFKTHHDSKPYGPSSIGLDISFPAVEHVYGIPEHADAFALKPTNGRDPYRLFNLDVFEYELDNPMALYGSIPLMLAHNWSKTIGVFWHNAAETWIDVSSSTANQNILGKLISMFKSDDTVPQTDTHWMSESGIIDLFIILGPRPHDVFRQYSALTGTPTMPPLFAVSYHQCRWNYNDEDDVRNVNRQFDEHDIPYDVLWLDIEHTNGKRYLTWDTGKFPTPVDMQDNLAKTGRKMVTIVDPHIKRDSGYHIHQEAEAADLYVKNSKDEVYDGWCWPGSSSWLDFFNPEIRKWWSERFLLQNYEGSSLNLFTWNDMNEPSVFNGPEVTMHKDAKHFGGWENRDVHNLYGMLQHQGTYEGHLMRSQDKERPFVLSRAFFAGTQRYGAIWTGDNFAAWDHLRASIPMILSVGVAGLPFVGADVGGFFKDPDSELLVRWYQAGIFYPFFRAHGHLDTKRREPYLLDEDKRNIVREAIKTRYRLLPYWYTLFYTSHVTGMPIMRPMWVEFPRDKNVYVTEDQFMIGSGILARPVMDQGATSAQLYLPKGVWYDYDDYTKYQGARRLAISSPLSKIPVFLRGGSIIPTKQRVRRSSALTRNDPFTLIVLLSEELTADGQLYVDDGHSNDYQKGAFILRDFKFSNSKLTSSAASTSGQFDTKEWLERVLVVGYPNKPTAVTLGDGTALRYKYDVHRSVVEIGRPGMNIATDFVISIS